MYKLLISLISFSLMAQSSNSERISEAFKESFKNRELECFYYQAKEARLVKNEGETELLDGVIQRNFKLQLEDQTLALNLKLYEQDTNYTYQVELADLKIKGPISKKDFYRWFEYGDNSFFLREADIKADPEGLFAAYSLNKLKCNIEFAKSKPIVLSGTHHINVHPHVAYDWRGASFPKVKEYYENFDSYVLIDGANRQGSFVNFSNFLKTGEYDLAFEVMDTKIEIPENIPFAISPAGYNDYIFPDTGEVEIYFTGGNHNYCIWNNTRNLLWGLFYSESNASLKINYVTEGSVVQKKGIIPGTSFSRRAIRKSQLLSDLFKSDEAKRKSYHWAYNNYFENDFLLRFTGLYKTLKYVYKDGDYEVKRTYQGKGERELTLILNYL